MDLEHSYCWLSLAQQPYPLISKFLQQLSDGKNNSPAGLWLKDWLKENHCKINKSQLEKSYTWLQHPDHHLIPFPQFPDRLQAINSPPAVLFLAGNPNLLFHAQLAIVGSRKPSSGGRENAIYFARTLAEAGLTVISGLAMGIDGLAHQSALEVDGDTAAVLGCGHNTCYPRQHRHLFQAIKAKGLLISEFAPDTPVKPYQFPRRNRIISGLSLGVLVVEAAIKSGSLITCRLAADQGRDVFAIPGDITNSLSRGCHHLIRHGACLVETPEQILTELTFSPPASFLTKENTAAYATNCTVNGLSADENKLLPCINRHPTSIDCLVIRSGMKMPLVLSVLFSLELKHMVIGTADGFFKRRPE